jgi:hypothetical protein
VFWKAEMCPTSSCHRGYSFLMPVSACAYSWVMAGAPFTRGPAYALLIAEALSGGAPPGSHYAAMLEEADPLRPWDAHLRRKS